MQVGFGSSVPGNSAPFRGYPVKSYIRAKGFDYESLVNDIALLFLYDDIPSNVAQTIKIYTGDLSMDMPLTSIGFGMTLTPSDNQTTTSLRYIKLNLVSTRSCANDARHFSSSTQICANAGGGKSACHGDSGGPLITRIGGDGDVALVGVNSFGPYLPDQPNTDCGRAGLPSYYTRPSHYLSWIAINTNLSARDISIPNPIASARSESASATPTKTFATRRHTPTPRHRPSI
ncbi:hypothetical protein GGI12_005637 [Dipsacomyces acuminosporus]|nr:hypothetical protein GGI12_005637 [Dipsacomyces acuminosporus]